MCGFLLWCHLSVTRHTLIACTCARCEICATRGGWSKEFMLESQLPSVVHCVIPKDLGGALPQGDMAARAFGGGRSGLSPWCLRDAG